LHTVTINQTKTQTRKDTIMNISLTTKWIIYSISILLILMHLDCFFPQWVEWYNGLKESPMTGTVNDMFLGAAFLGLFFGAIAAVPHSMCVGVLICTILGAGIWVATHNSTILVTVAYLVCYLVSFFLFYLIKETKKRRLQHA